MKCAVLLSCASSTDYSSAPITCLALLAPAFSSWGELLKLEAPWDISCPSRDWGCLGGIAAGPSRFCGSAMMSAVAAAGPSGNVAVALSYLPMAFGTGLSQAARNHAE